MAPQCQFFLQPSERIGHHLSVIRAMIPRQFHTYVRNNVNKSPQEIFDGLFKDSQYDEKKFGRTKEEALSYIQKVKESYLKIFASTK